MGLLADKKNVMADLQVNKTWSFGNQRWFRVALIAGHAFTPFPHAALSYAWISFQVSSEVTPGCGPAVQEGS